MKSIQKNEEFNTFLEEKDKQVLSKIIESCRNRIVLPEIGLYRKLAAEEIWIHLVGQVCIMGGARQLEKLMKDMAQWAAFKTAVSLKQLSEENNGVEYLAAQLRSFKATRFYNQSAAKLISMLSNPSMFRNGDLVLFEGLSENPFLLREDLMRRNPVFRLKSASDFMITVGLSQDVIPLDTRIIGMFQRYFDYNYTLGAVQDKPFLYLSVEETLRQFCREKDIPLALLDRILFNYSGMSLIEFLIEE